MAAVYSGLGDIVSGIAGRRGDALLGAGIDDHAGVKAFTEALEHELRNTSDCQISAHLLIPGFVYTPLTSRGRSEKPDAAWTPEQTVDFMIDSLEKGDFYILCPDNDVDRATDEKRIAWAAGDIIENRPPLSRWHPDYAEAFKDYLKT
ncbi:hypothetical protein IMCC20628_04313 [Hoeflea sp. IMCC20628]|nr:hypothetical protein IMCC20628_04313 [Hoeflea sp. IMCC20628]